MDITTAAETDLITDFHVENHVDDTLISKKKISFVLNLEKLEDLRSLKGDHVSKDLGDTILEALRQQSNSILNSDTTEQFLSQFETSMGGISMEMCKSATGRALADGRPVIGVDMNNPNVINIIELCKAFHKRR